MISIVGGCAGSSPPAAAGPASARSKLYNPAPFSPPPKTRPGPPVPPFSPFLSPCPPGSLVPSAGPPRYVSKVVQLDVILALWEDSR